MAYLCASLSLIGLAVLACRLFRLNPFFAFFFALSAVGLILYPFGFTEYLRQAAWCVMLVGLAALPLAPVFFKQGPCRLNKRLFVIATVQFSLAVGLGYYLLSDAYVHRWDEFNHWALQTKTIFLLDRYGDSPRYGDLLSYPPLVHIFHYYFGFISEFSESRAYMAHFMITLAPLLVFFERASRNPVYFIIQALFIVFGIQILGQGVWVLEVDQVVATFFLGSLAAYFFSLRRGNKFVYLFPPLFVLVLLKSSGLFLALIVLSAIAADKSVIFFFARPSIHANALRLRRGIRTSACVLALFLALLGAKYSWACWVEAKQLNVVFPTSQVNLHSIRQALSGATAKSAEIRERFISHWLREPAQDIPERQIYLNQALGRRLLSGVWSPAIYSLLSAGLLALAAYQARTRLERRRTLTLATVAGLGYLLYLIGMLLLYNFSFSDYEGRRLASFARYDSVYVLPLFLLATGLVCRRAFVSRTSLRSLAVPLALLLGLFLCQTPDLSKDERLPVWGPRERFKAILQQAHALPPDASIYLVMEDGTYFLQVIARYELHPRRTNPKCWALTRTDSAGEALYLCDYSPEQWIEALRDYDYLLLLQTNESFWQKYGALFEERADRRSIRYWRIDRGQGFKLVAVEHGV